MESGGVSIRIELRQIGLGEIIALVEQGHAVRPGAGIRKAVCEVQVRGMSADPSVALGRVHGLASDIGGNRSFLDAKIFDELCHGHLCHFDHRRRNDPLLKAACIRFV